MRRIALLLPLLLLAGAALAPAADARRRKKPPVVIEKEDGKLIHLQIEGKPDAEGWLYRSMVLEDDQGKPIPADLFVALHGHGGDPKNFILQNLMTLRDAFCLTVAGRGRVPTDRGEGRAWDGGDVETVAALTRHVLEHYPVDKERVVVWGHSAGGSMTLATLAHAPELFAGGLTTAAPRTPTSSHNAQRICVILGDQDPNWAGAPAVRAHVESLRKKRAKGACAFFRVEGLGHALPSNEHLDFGFSWVLRTGARGGEATVPMRLPVSSSEWSWIRVSSKKAKKTLKPLLKALKKGRAWFPFEAACHSEHRETAPGGGWIAKEDLEKALGSVPALERGEVSDIIKTEAGHHLVWHAGPS